MPYSIFLFFCTNIREILHLHANVNNRILKRPEVIVSYLDNANYKKIEILFFISPFLGYFLRTIITNVSF